VVRGPQITPMRDQGSALPSRDDRASSSVPARRESRNRVRYWILVGLAIVSGVALRRAALYGSLLGDDWDHYAMWASAYPVRRSALDMFNFVGLPATERLALLRSGRLPWWTDPDFHLAFLRPLPSVLAYFDYALLGPESPLRHHWHSAVWWAASVAAVAAVLVRSVPRSVAVLAVVLYAVDDAHALPVAWSANRGEFVAVALMFGGLAAQLDWMQRRRPVSRVVSLLLVSAGMLAGEYALGLFGYFVAYALCADRSRGWAWVRTHAPLAAPVVVYLVAHAGLGYGTVGSSFYVDPFREPLRYAHASVVRIPVLLADLGFGYAAEWWYGDPPWRQRFIQDYGLPEAWLSPSNLYYVSIGLGLLSLALVLVALFRLRRRAPEGPGHPLVWLLWGALLALLPVSGALAMSRLTIGSALGFHAALAWIVVGAGRAVVQQAATWKRLLAVAVVAAVLGVHGVHAALRGRDEAAHYALRSRLEEDWVLHAEIAAGDLSARHVIIVSARDLASQFCLPFVRRLHGLSVPSSSEVLLPTWDGPLELTRVADNVFDLRATRLSDSRAFRTSAYRLESSEFQRGQVFVGERFNVVVMAVEHGDAVQLRFAFPKSLDDRRYLFLYPVSDGLKQLRLPAVGGTVHLQPPPWPSFHRTRAEG
jgi:hypothetical protein